MVAALPSASRAELFIKHMKWRLAIGRFCELLTNFILTPLKTNY